MLCELCADCVACAEYRALLQHQMQPAITEGAISASVPAVGQTPSHTTVQRQSPRKKRRGSPLHDPFINWSLTMSKLFTDRLFTRLAIA